MKKQMLALAIALCGAQAWANPEPLLFTPELGEGDFGDWHLVCDNVGTCRAAGYYADEVVDFSDEKSPYQAVSLLLKREAGKPEIMGKLNLLPDAVADIKDGEALALFIDDAAQGTVAWSTEALSSLNPEQVAAILATGGKAVIELRHQDKIWRLSDKGMREVLLKMDEVQGFADTAAAIIDKGDKPVPTQTYAYPTLADKPVLDQEARVIKRGSDEGKALLEVLRAHQQSVGTSLDNEEFAANLSECEVLATDAQYEEGSERGDFSAQRLSDTQTLVMGLCWMGPYNLGNAAWVMDGKLSEVQAFVGSEFDPGLYGNRLTHLFKGRGLGDCASVAELTWDGSAFVKTAEGSYGQCKGFPGGAWYLPTLVVDVESVPDDLPQH